MDRFERTAMLVGDGKIVQLSQKKVYVFGVGGVGSFCCEALARGGVGAITLIDNDTVSKSNINRQLVALESTVGMKKTEVMKQRILDINPNCKVEAIDIFYTDGAIDFSDADYVVDAIDTVSSKLALICTAKEKNIPIVSSMGTGNKLDPAAFKIADIYKTSVCPLARVMRKELKERGIKSLDVLYSEEAPLTPKVQISDGSRRQIPASISFVPPVAGMIIAGHVIKELCGYEK